MKLLTMIQGSKKEPKLTQNTNENYDSPITPLSPKKSKSKFKRGNLTLCLILTPGQKFGEFKNLLKEESMLSDKHENQKFLIVEPPAFITTVKERSYPVYICDSEKGVTVSLSWERDLDLAKLCCDPHMLSNVFDEAFISKASNIKADWKQLVGVALMSLIFGGLIGLCL